MGSGRNDLVKRLLKAGVEPDLCSEVAAIVAELNEHDRRAQAEREAALARAAEEREAVRLRVQRCRDAKRAGQPAAERPARVRKPKKALTERPVEPRADPPHKWEMTRDERQLAMFAEVEAAAPVVETAVGEKRAHRLPKDWRVTPHLRLWAKTVEGFADAAIDRETEKFRDYWAASGKMTGSKLDWDAAWRYWMRNAKDRGGNGGTGGKGGGGLSDKIRRWADEQDAGPLLPGGGREALRPPH